MMILLLLITAVNAFYVVEYCKDEAMQGWVTLAHCTGVGCDNTAYQRTCGHLAKFENTNDALEFINNKGKRREDIHVPRGFVFENLYRTEKIQLSNQTTKEKRSVTFQEEREFEVQKYVIP